ncbi:unnamed protein product [Bursaphelenchus xylophilus]|uniref:(pine wood nematode) hypothetical protein n=1 Tax=Bursaphelenchus xylophilus TaxID=6326 RepID=A0A7I8XBM3_BURXY|nr:unnamed protein product [Bursaphelenchus xylophilus]CAG9083984.1 unnamed protein product [Bursaphelenchus xylophilus]
MAPVDNPVKCLEAGYALLPGTRDLEGRPVIFVPLRENCLHFKADSITSVIYFLSQCTGEDFLSKKLVFVIDMRNAAKGDHLRLFLKIIEENFVKITEEALVIRNDKFWDRHKSAVEKGRYQFDVKVISGDHLVRFIDRQELIREYGGSLEYNHNEWINTRRMIDSLFKDVAHILQDFEQQCSSIRNFPLTSTTISETDKMIDSIEQSIELTVNKVQTCEARVNQVEKSLALSTNPGFRSGLNRLHKSIEDLKRRRREVNSLFASKRSEAAIVTNMNNIEDEIEKIKPILFDIGKDADHARILLADHQNTMKNVNNVKVTYDHLETQCHKNWSNRAQMSPIRMDKGVATHFKYLQNEWKMLRSILQDREKILSAAIKFHEKYRTFIENSQRWIQNVGVDPATVENAPAEILQSALQKHEEFKESFENCYAEAFNAANELKSALDRDSRDCNSVVSADKYVKDCITQLSNIQKQLYGIYDSRHHTIGYKYHAKVFFQECDVVLNWLDEHGEPYLRRKIGIGRSLDEAKRFEKYHEEFKKISENTYVSTKKLTESSQILIDGGEIDPMKARLKIEELTHRMKSFTKKVDSRTKLLYIACNFFMHYKEIMDYYKSLKQNDHIYYTVYPDPQKCEENKSRLQDEVNKITQAYNRIMAEARQLKLCLDEQRNLFEVNNQDSMDLVQDMMDKIDSCNNTEKNKWPRQRNVLNLATDTSFFVRESDSVLREILAWREDLQRYSNLHENALETIAHAQRENMANVENAVLKLLSKKNQLITDMQRENVNLVFPNKENVIKQLEIIATHLEQGSKQVMQLAETLRMSCLSTAKLDKLINDKEIIMKMLMRIKNDLIMLNCIPANERETEDCKLEHEKYKKRLEEIKEHIITFEKSAGNTRQYIMNYEQDTLLNNALDIATSEFARIKQKLDNRLRMLTSAADYYKCFANALPSAEVLEKNYKDILDPVRRQGICQKEMKMNATQRSEVCKVNLNKLNDKKDQFLNATSYAHKCAASFWKKIELFVKSEFNGFEAPRNVIHLMESVAQMKQEIFLRQTRLLDLYKNCHEQLLACRNAAHLIVIIAEINGKLNSLESNVSSTSITSIDDSSLQEYVQRLKEFRIELKSILALMRNMRKHSDHFFEQFNNSLHTDEIKIAIPALNDKYSRVEREITAKEVELRRLSGGDSFQHLFDRNSDGSLEEKLTQSSESSSTFALDANEKLRKPYKELLNSEADYISDLGKCIDCYLKSYRLNEMSSSSLRQKEKEIFGNIEEIYRFHQEEFLDKLKEYEGNPEDVGCCFIHYMVNLKELYTEYCLNKAENGSILDSPEAMNLFNEIREKYNLPHSLDISSMLIKPVQRITRYRLLLDQVMRYSKHHTEEMRDALEVVVNIPRVANDRMHLKNFEDYKNHQIGEFILQDTFTVTEPKRVFKKEKELQKEELPNRKIRYIYKYKYLTTDVSVVEHVGSDGDNRFALRKGSLPQSEAVILKTNTSENRNLWVKTLRTLTLNADLISNNNSINENGAILSRELTSSVGRLKLGDLENKRHSNGSINSNEMPVVLRKSPSFDSPDLKNSDIHYSNDPRSTVYSTTSSDGDLPPALDHVSLIVPANEVLD